MAKVKKFLLLFIAVFCIHLDVYATEIPDVQSPCYSVMDACSGEILFSKNGDLPLFPASSVKLVTAMAVLDAAPIDKIIIITEDMLSHVPADATQMHLLPGGEYNVYELLQMMLISSAADAAQALAEGCFGSYDECLLKMNEKAISLGLIQTHFDNVIGLDINNGFTQTYTTANEFAKLSRLAMSYDVIRFIVSTPAYAISERTNNAAILKLNTNQFYSKEPYSNTLYTIIGSKTGTTKYAQNVLITTANNGINEVICTSFQNPTRSLAYTETRKALDYTFLLNYTGALPLDSKYYKDWYKLE